MDFIKEKIFATCKKINSLVNTSSQTLEYSFIHCPEYKQNNTPPALSEPWLKPSETQRYVGADNHYWIHLTIPAIKKIENKEPRLYVTTGREGGWDATNPQILVYFNGKTVQGMDTNHTWVPLEFDKDYDVYMYLFTGMYQGNFGFVPSVKIADLQTEALYYDINVPYSCMCLMDEGSDNYIKIREHLDKACQIIDFRDIYSDDYYTSVQAASKYLYDEFYEKVCGKTDAVLNCIGCTHLDVAWLWTVAQSREKTQRSFSIAMNLMKRYKDYKFTSSQPQLYEFVKENDPELYEQIRQMVTEERWEPEGAMWLEPDTNLISGESLVRQIMYGKKFFKDEFGKDSKILWLPDVFGFSGAIPQIMQKSGVTQLYTTKMMWNDTNQMPNDNFVWEGIDGSKVFVAFHEMNMKLAPKQIKQSWDHFKDKDIINETIYTFGFCDGGGGTTCEMMENFERLKYGIPGMPKTVISFAGDYIDKAEKAYNNADIYKKHKWVGEMYLELHRGTYTSIAKNKKNNRKSELLYQQAESLATTDMLLNNGAYPKDTFDKNQKTILLNQFHDILPGSSIQPVYDVTDKEYAEILKDGRNIADTCIENIKATINTDGGIFVYNPTPFEVSDYVEVDGKMYFAQNIPAHGWKVIEDKEAKDKIIVTENSMENDVIKIVFNDKYHLVSVYDKEAQREVLADGAEANCLEVFEDYPRDWDAWEINDYYVQKKWLADSVDGITLLENGIRIKRKYQKSVITQDILMKPGSKRIDFVTHLDWREDHVLLKAAFPVDIHSTNATYDIQFGNIERPTHRNTPWDSARFEVSAQKWADLSECGYGVSILNDCKYGYSIEDNNMKITLIKCAAWPSPIADRCEHEFTYSLYPHSDDFRTGGTVKQGYLVNMPLEATKIAPTSGNTPDSYSLAYTNCENVVIETIKKAENENAVVVRMYDAYNKKAKTNITVGFDFKEVYVCDLLENNEHKLVHNGRNVCVDVKNFEIVTLKFII